MGPGAQGIGPVSAAPGPRLPEPSALRPSMHCHPLPVLFQAHLPNPILWGAALRADASGTRDQGIWLNQREKKYQFLILTLEVMSRHCLRESVVDIQRDRSQFAQHGYLIPFKPQVNQSYLTEEEMKTWRGYVANRAQWLTGGARTTQAGLGASASTSPPGGLLPACFVLVLGMGRAHWL